MTSACMTCRCGSPLSASLQRSCHAQSNRSPVSAKLIASACTIRASTPTWGQTNSITSCSRSTTVNDSIRPPTASPRSTHPSPRPVVRTRPRARRMNSRWVRSSSWWSASTTSGSDCAQYRRLVKRAPFATRHGPRSPAGICRADIASIVLFAQWLTPQPSGRWPVDRR